MRPPPSSAAGAPRPARVPGTAVPAARTGETPAQPTCWQRRVASPLLAQLRQGVTPEKLALTIAFGLVLGCFPILGSATLLCGLAAVVFRLNQPAIQLVNYAAYPLQLALLIPYYRAGEWLFQTPPVPLSIPLLSERFTADFGQFMHDYGRLALQGIAVWCLLAPVAAAAVYFLSRAPLRVLARGRLR